MIDLKSISRIIIYTDGEYTDDYNRVYRFSVKESLYKPGDFSDIVIVWNSPSPVDDIENKELKIKENYLIRKESKL